MFDAQQDFSDTFLIYICVLVDFSLLLQLDFVTEAEQKPNQERFRKAVILQKTFLRLSYKNSFYKS